MTESLPGNLQGDWVRGVMLLPNVAPSCWGTSWPTKGPTQALLEPTLCLFFQDQAGDSTAEP